MVSNGGGRRKNLTAGAQNEANRVTKKGNASFSLPTMGAKNKFPTSVSSSLAGIGTAGTIVGQLPSFQKCSNQVSDLVEVAPSRGSVNDIGDIKLSAKEVVDRSLAGVANDPTIADQPIVFQEYTNQISGAVDVTLSDNSPAGEIEGVGFSSNTMPMTEAFDSSLDAIANGPTTAYQPISVQDCTIQFSGDLASTGEGYVGETKGVGSSSGIIQIAEEAVDRSLPLSSSVAVNIKTSSLDKWEENLDHLITQHVVIAPHFRVTELESRGLSFGNLGASFKRRTSFPEGPVIEDSFTLRTSDLKPKLSNANASEAPANHGDFGPRKDLDILHFVESQNVTMSDDIKVPEFESYKLSFGTINASFKKGSHGANGADIEDLEFLHVAESQNVTMPHDVQVPEFEGYKLSFGTVNACFKRGSHIANHGDFGSRKDLDILHFVESQNVTMSDDIKVPEFESYKLSFGTINASFKKGSHVANSADIEYLEILHVVESQNVTMPHDVQVPEFEGYKLSFGTVNACFKRSSHIANSSDIEDRATRPSKLSHKVEAVSRSSMDGFANGPTKPDQVTSLQQCTSQVNGAFDVSSSKESSGGETEGVVSSLLTAVDKRSYSTPGESSAGPVSVSKVYPSAPDLEIVPYVDHQARSPDKFCGSKRVIWAPVKQSNRDKSSAEGNRSNVVGGLLTFRKKHDVQKEMRLMRDAMQRYVPKLISEEFRQQGNSEYPCPSHDQVASGNMNSYPQFEPKSCEGGRVERERHNNPQFPAKPENEVYKLKKQSKMRAVWRPRDSQVPRMNNQFFESISVAPCHQGYYNGHFITGQQTVYTGRDQGSDVHKQVNMSVSEQEKLYYQCQRVGSPSKSEDSYWQISEKAQEVPQQAVNSLTEKIKGLNVKTQTIKGPSFDDPTGVDEKADKHVTMKELCLKRAKQVQQEEEERTRQRKANARRGRQWIPH